MEVQTIRLKDCDPNFTKEIMDAGGKKVNLCFQCGTCTAGCPTVYAMDYTPRQIMRMVNLGMKEEVLKSSTIWLCSSCFTCQTRCPRGVEITSVMGALKNIAIKDGAKVANKKGPGFHRSFVEVTRDTGRLFEPLLMLKFAGKTENSIGGALKSLIKDAPLGMELVKKGKMSFLPTKIKRTDQLKTIYENVRKMEEKAE